MTPQPQYSKTTPVDPAPAAPAPDGHPPADGDVDSERIRPAALSDLDRLMANVFERWRLIQDLAASDPYDADDDCHHCEHVRSRPHADDCLHLRANRLVDQTGDRP